MTINARLVDDFTEDEQYLVGQAYAGEDAPSKKITVITEIYVARMYRESARLTIEANEEIAKQQIEASRERALASEKQAKSLTLATWVLAGVTGILAAATLLLYFAS